jgi:hypothetical protein
MKTRAHGFGYLIHDLANLFDHRIMLGVFFPVKLVWRNDLMI